MRIDAGAGWSPSRGASSGWRHLARDVRLPRIIGHRGVAARAPENTLAGFRKAAELGLEWVEFDVRLTADGRPVVIHDAALDRTTDGRGPVAEASFEAVRALDAGSWFAPDYADERVPSLEEAIALVAGLGLGACVEIKPDPRRREEAGRTVMVVLGRCWPRGRPRPLVSSFDPTTLAAARGVAPSWPIAFLMRRPMPRWRAKAKALRCLAVHCRHDGLTRRSVRRLKAAGLPLAVYAVNEPARARVLLEWGVDSIITDAPEAMLEAFARGAAGTPAPAASPGCRRRPGKRGFRRG